MKASALLCIPEYENLFCLRTNETDWEEILCSKSDGLITCQLYKKFYDYTEFFAWKIGTYSVKMRIQIEDSELEEYITLPIAVTPSNKCEDIDSVETDDTMFVKPIAINCGRSA